MYVCVCTYISLFASILYSCLHSRLPPLWSTFLPITDLGNPSRNQNHPAIFARVPRPRVPDCVLSLYRAPLCEQAMEEAAADAKRQAAAQAEKAGGEEGAIKWALERLEGEHETLKADKVSVESKAEALEGECVALRGECEHLKAELVLVKSEVESGRSEWQKAVSEAHNLRQAAAAGGGVGGGVEQASPSSGGGLQSPSGGDGKAGASKAGQKAAGAAQEREQKLVVSLLYDLSMELHRTKMYQRANSEAPPLHSWLAKQRGNADGGGGI
jgi:hypothetical protein